MRRRTVLAGAAALPLLGLSGPALRGIFSERKRLVYDERLGRADLAARRARDMGLQTVATGGEIAALLRAQRWADGSDKLVGLTGYSEYVLAHDILRRHGRPVQAIAQFDARDRWLERPGGDNEAHRLAAALLADDETRVHSRATGFVWLA